MSPPIGAPAPRASKPLDVQACEQFLLHEARLLDECRFDEWLALFTPDASYWVPSEPDQKSPLDTVSLIYDDRRLLETRVRRLASPRIYSQEPRSRTSRVVTNVTIEDATDPVATLVRSKFVLIEFRRNEQRLFGGTSFHRLKTDRRQHQNRVEKGRSGQLRRPHGWHRGAVLGSVAGSGCGGRSLSGCSAAEAAPALPCRSSRHRIAGSCFPAPRGAHRRTEPRNSRTPSPP